MPKPHPGWYNHTVTENWLRSTRCASGNCVEVAVTDSGVLFRDSKNPQQPPAAFDHQTWREFVTAVKDGEIPA